MSATLCRYVDEFPPVKIWNNFWVNSEESNNSRIPTEALFKHYIYYYTVDSG